VLAYPALGEPSTVMIDPSDHTGVGQVLERGERGEWN